MRLPTDEFLRRFLLHLLPRGFVRIRHFGFLANRRRSSLLPICFQLLRRPSQQAAPAEAVSRPQIGSSWRCPLCGGTMRIVDVRKVPDSIDPQRSIYQQASRNTGDASTAGIHRRIQIA
jgi:hypothetical protein